MATVRNTGTEGLSYLFDSLSILQSAGPDDSRVSRGATRIVVNPNPFANGPTFTGTGFAFDAAGRPTGGTVTEVSLPGYKVSPGYGIAGIQVPLTALYAAAVQGAGATLAAGLLGGADTFQTDASPGGTVRGYDGDDLFRGAADNGVAVDGGAGVDTVELDRLRADAAVEVRPGSILVTRTATGAPSTYTSVEAIRFLDGTLSVDPATVGGQVYIFFQGALGRAPGAGELGYFTDAASTHGLPAVAAGLLAAPEAQARLGGLGDAGFIDAVYRAALGRGAEPGGLQYWQGRLAAGDAGRAGVLAGIAASDEARGRFAADLAPGVFGADPEAVAVDRVYLAATGALPAADALSRGIAQPLRATEASLAGNGLSDADFVASLIRNAYGAGASDPGAVAYYTQALSGGAGTRADVLHAYAFSPGIDARVAPYVTDHGVLHA